ncbi:SURF1 family protein [uncultured Jatrophihabitans sp.]|uniref:SURF1 family protein n=1 Tax=uncultured Jatrophihabitans sp. TaxID=1610747 RepID=UPI0035C971C6
MLRAARSGWVWTLRQPRYATLAAIMVLLAVGCVGAGTFELHRFHEKRHDNRALKANYHSAAVPLTTDLVPLTGAGAAPDTLAIRWRTVTARGSWDASGQQYLGNESRGDEQGFIVLTPLRTSTGTLLVARGFLAATSSGARPKDAPAPPLGTVTVRGRLYPTSSSNDGSGQLPDEEITAVNATRQAARLGLPVYQAYAALEAYQSGTLGLDALPGPSLDNPTGGAGELQLLSYVVQWYVFALLALLAPFAFARADAREARRRFLGLDDDDVEFDLAARRPVAALDAGDDAHDLAPAVRASAELARAGADVRWQAAERLADRYGRSLGPRPDANPALRRAPALREPAGPDSAHAPHRSSDSYHGTYNDYLWSLAMADGNLPEVVPDTPVHRVTDPTEHNTDGSIDAAEGADRCERDR